MPKPLPHPGTNIPAPTVVHVCVMCGASKDANTGKPRANPIARQLVKDVRTQLTQRFPKQADNIQVRLSRCLGACHWPLAYAFTSPGHETLVFGYAGAPPENGRDAAHIATTAHAYATNRPGKRYREPHLPKAERSICFSRVPAPPAVKPTKA